MTRAKRGEKSNFDFAIILDSIKHLNANCVFAIRKKCFLLSYTYHFLTQEIEKSFFSTRINYSPRAVATLCFAKNPKIVQQQQKSLPKDYK